MDMKEYSVKVADDRNIRQTSDDRKTVEDQITLHKSESMPEYSTVHNIGLQVVWGRVGLKLNDEDVTIYYSGSVINIPAKTKIALSKVCGRVDGIFGENLNQQHQDKFVADQVISRIIID